MNMVRDAMSRDHGHADKPYRYLVTYSGRAVKCIAISEPGLIAPVRIIAQVKYEKGRVTQES